MEGIGSASTKSSHSQFLRRLVLAITCIAVLGATALTATSGAQDPSPEDPLGDLPLNPEWLSNTLERASTTAEVKNNTVDGAIERRDQAIAEWKAAQNQAKAYGPRAKRAQKAAKAAARKADQAKGTQKGKQLAKRAVKLKRKAQKLAVRAAGPSPYAKPEYSVVWSGKQNAGDVNAGQLSQLIQNATVNPQGILDLLNPQFLPGLDGFQVIDMRKYNVDGTDNPDYGRVVNFVQLPLPWGLETEAHHMQYEWNDGDPIVAGALFTDVTFVMNVDDVPNMSLSNIIPPQETPLGTIPDAYDSVGDGRFIGTYMGGPEANFGGSPGAAAVLKPDPVKGLVLENEVPAGNVGGVQTGNAGGVPEPCSVREGRPLGTCANPHGIQIRQDLHRMVTADYAEPREIVLDPAKTVDKYTFRPTVRTWDTSDPSNPKLVSVAHMPDGPFDFAQRAHQQMGMMEDAKTWPTDPDVPGMLESKGVFAGSMCGGGIFFTPDVTKLQGDSSESWNQVWNDGLSALAAGGDSEFVNEPGACAGGAWHQVSRNNKLLFRSVQGRAVGADNYFDQGSPKMIYDVDIRALVRSAQDGHIQCDLSRGTDTDGDGTVDLSGVKTFNALAKGKKVADCPQLVSVLNVHDKTSGGPHWGALDNHSLTADGYPTRMVFSDYFVARTGIDGDHRFYAVNIDPNTHVLTYDKDFRDEKTGAIGVDFNRRNWPGSPDAGFYKPHSMLWVCPPGICPAD
jgi:hypothetical protein